MSGNQPSECYQQRFFAYADILGFTPLVKPSESDIGAFETIRSLLSRMEKSLAIWSKTDLARMLPEDSIPKPLRDVLLQMADDNRQFAFTDTILFSGANDADGLWNILTNLSILTLDLLKAGWLLRGGIALGSLFQRGAAVFGPVYIEAYDLEKNVVGQHHCALTKPTQIPDQSLPGLPMLASELAVQ
jgi:hypothetical protein